MAVADVVPERFNPNVSASRVGVAKSGRPVLTSGLTHLLARQAR